MKKTLLILTTLSTIWFGCTKSKNNNVVPITTATNYNATNHINPLITATFIIDTTKYSGGEILNGNTINYFSPANVEIDSSNLNGAGYWGKVNAKWVYIGDNKFRTDIPVFNSTDTGLDGKGGYFYGVPYVGPFGHQLANEGVDMMVIIAGDTTIKF